MHLKEHIRSGSRREKLIIWLLLFIPIIVCPPMLLEAWGKHPAHQNTFERWPRAPTLVTLDELEPSECSFQCLPIINHMDNFLKNGQMTQLQQWLSAPGAVPQKSHVPPYSIVYIRRYQNYISPCFCALEKARYILFSLSQHKHCSATESHQSSLYFWLGQTYSSFRRNIVNHDELTQPVLGPGDGPPSSWGRNNKGSKLCHLLDKSTHF